MHKSITHGLLSAALLAVPTLAQAQVTEQEDAAPKTSTVSTATEITSDQHLVETNHFWDNWFITVGGGAQMYFGDHEKQMKLKDRLTPSISAGIGKWFTPGLGVRFMYDGYQYKGVTQDKSLAAGGTYDWTHSADYTTSAPPLYKQKIDYFHVHANVLFNLNNLFAGWKSDRFWNIIPYAGFGYAVTKNKHTAREITADMGLINTFRLCKALDLSLDVHGTLMNDRFDGEVGERRKDGGFGATLGLVYKFRQRDWNRSTRTTIYDQSESDELRERLNRALNENDRLKNDLANRPEAKEVHTVEKSILASPAYVTFKINSSKLSKEARVSLGMFADAVKKADHKQVYVIAGFADAATGNASINQKLSEARVQAVYRCLTEEFGVPSSQLETKPQGGVGNMFYDEPCLSRAVITRVK